MTTLAALQRQIEKLQEEADRIRKTEASEAIAKVKELVEQFGLTPQDVFGRGTRGGKASKRAVRKSVGVPKYRDPKTGATWTGQGRAPKWIANKKDRSGFLIDQDGGAAAVEVAPRTTRAGKPAAKKPATKKATRRDAPKGSKRKTAPTGEAPSATGEGPQDVQR